MAISDNDKKKLHYVFFENAKKKNPHDEPIE